MSGERNDPPEASSLGICGGKGGRRWRKADIELAVKGGKIAFTLQIEFCMTSWREEYPRLGIDSTASEASRGRH